MLVYKDGGQHSRPGGTFDFKSVATISELQAAKKDGWFLTLAGVETGEDPEAAYSSQDAESLIDDRPEDKPATRAAAKPATKATAKPATEKK